MIKRLSIIFFILACFYKVYAQQYGNEWINYTQKHYRISIPKTGLYRIDSITLANSGIPLTSINPKNFQLFIKGVEQYIYIKGENDNVLNAGDYIEFYAKKNDGLFDSLAYTALTRLPNPHVALFNDTNSAFLTWNSSLVNNRVIPETDVNFSGYTPAPYFYRENIFAGNNTYSGGNSYISGSISDPRYIVGEGFGNNLDKGGGYQTPFTTNFVYTITPLPVTIKVSYSGNSASTFGVYDHQVITEFFDNTNNLTLLNDTSFFGYKQFYIERQTTSDKLQNQSVIKITNVNAFGSANNRINIHYVTVKYPSLYNFNGSSEDLLYIDDNTSASKTYVDLQNFNVGSNQVILYDLTNHKYISTNSTSSTVKALIPNSGFQKQCYITTSTNITQVTQLVPVNQIGYFVDYRTTNPDSAFVIISNKALSLSATQYAAYRQSPAGGSNQVILSYVDELYDQFAYGNSKNPLAIKNFCRFLIDSLPAPPKYLLLLGKSIKEEYTRGIPVLWTANLLPTMGRPPSDNQFTTALKGLNSATPFIPTGRISAKTDDDALHYLEKVKTHEQTLSLHEDWRKHVLHFAGGTNANEQAQFRNFLGIDSTIIADTLFGGRVYSFQKTTTAPIQITISDSVKSLINYGASVISFFGHGSVTGFDQAIDDPNAYNNLNKYPFFIANSCYSGDIHRPEGVSTSESFTLIEKKGSIGFIAASSVGVVAPLFYFTKALYNGIAYHKYYQGVGDAVKYSCIQNSIFPDQLQEITGLDMTLEGDPSIRVNAYKQPDFEINNSSVSFNTQTYVDSIGLNIKIKNLGHAINDTFAVRIERYFPTGDSTSFLKKIKAPYNTDSLKFFILKDFVNGVGLNHFKVYIDSYNEITELSESNNSTSGFVDLFIPGGDIVPVYPYKYAIIPLTTQVTLKASTADPFSPATVYRMELDTNDLFNSPALNTTTITSTGGVVEWTVNLPYQDSTVYFWRVTKDTLTSNLNWRESSFQTIGTKTGWAQAHFHQFKNDNYQFVKYKKAQRRFDFENDVKSLECNDAYEGYLSFDEINYKINTSLEDYYSCAPGPGGWSFAVFDSISAKAMLNDTPAGGGITPYGNCKCVNYTLKSFAFGPVANGCGSLPNWQNDIVNFINNIGPNQKILAWSMNNHQSKSFSNAVYNAFESFGACNIRNVEDSVPYIIFGTKGGALCSANEVMGLYHSSIIKLTDTLKTKWNNGYIASEIIGPSVNWRSLHWKQLPVELPNTDSIVVKVIGIRSNGIRDTLVTFSKDSTDIFDLGNYVNAATYPHMQLVARTWDNTHVTPPQLKKWQVIYDEVPECAINPKKGFTINNATLNEGDDLIVHLPIENIGALPFTDSLLVTYWITDRSNVIHQLPQKLKLKPFVPQQVIVDTIKFNTYQYPGTNYLWVDVNPPANTKYQLEQYHFNNIARIAFNVSADRVNPLLDVTFDGTHILNGDVISAKPNVLVSLKDENKFLALNDTDDFAVFIKYPNQPTEKKLYFANNMLRFTPAQLPNNSCKIQWSPELLEDGKYTLIVQAKDRSKNVSGAVDYNIQFEIINKQTVTEVLNYPNPFSTSTKFVFTLTGSEVPDIFTVQIMTITGKVVKEITKDELGNLHIGRNITQYAWDGKDEFGDKLGNGVYLYRIITRHNGQAVEKNATDADSFFKKGIGKMVIMR